MDGDKITCDALIKLILRLIFESEIVSVVFADSLLSGLQRVFLSAGNAADHILNIALVEVFWVVEYGRLSFDIYMMTQNYWPH